MNTTATARARARGGAGPIAGPIRTVGRWNQLAVSSIAHTVSDSGRLRFPLRDAIIQAWMIVGVTALPAILISIPFGVIVSAQIGGLTQQIGATSIVGAAGGVGVIRQGAPIVAALLLGGAAGAAIASELGARTIREEIDALRTMGVDPVRRLVAPRVLAMTAVAPALCMVIIVMGIGAGYVISVGVQGVTPGSYLSSLSSFATMTDLYIAIVKSVLFGFVVATIACQRGLEAGYGPKGVADAVNSSVVIGVLAAFALNLVVTQFVSMFIPTGSP